MAVFDYVLLSLMICLGITAALSDIRSGIIPNKLIAGFAVIGVILDFIYYGILARDVLLVFLINVLVTTIISLCLYFTHALAGGDCKLIPVLSMLYPAGMYLTYGRSSITLFASICFAIFFGYIYLLLAAIWSLITGETRVTAFYIKKTLVAYLKSYITATIYVMAVNLAFAFIDVHLIKVNAWIVWVGCIIAAWSSGRIALLKKKEMIAVILLIDVGLTALLRVIPFSLNPTTYLFTAVLLLCQMTIKTNLYKQIPTLQVRKGMILSTVSSVMMQNSGIEGLPGISAEDLRNRLSDTEAESVRRWGKSTKGLKDITIVKKIPFAIFIAMGYVAYFIIWSIVQ